jgi:hypothetical protein
MSVAAEADGGGHKGARSSVSNAFLAENPPSLCTCADSTALTEAYTARFSSVCLLCSELCSELALSLSVNATFSMPYIGYVFFFLLFFFFFFVPW